MIGTHPWNHREPTIDQNRKFDRLLFLHQLTGAWTKALTHLESPSFSIERMPKITLQQNLWLLEKMRLDEISLDLRTLVAAEDIDTFLHELAETIWIIQLSTLENALNQTTDIPLLINIFKTTSWAQGKAVAELEWKSANLTELKQGYQALVETHSDSPSSFLLGQSNSNSLSFFWRNSPYQNEVLNRSSRLEKLTEMHEEWILGFFYGLSRNFHCTSRMVKNHLDSNWVEFSLTLRS